MTSLSRNRDFRILWSGRAVSELGSAITAIALPLFALEYGPAYAGLVLAMETVAQLAVSLIAGAYVDRSSRRLVLLSSVAVRVLALVAFVGLYLTGGITLFSIFVLAIVNGIAQPFFSSAETAAVKAVVAEDDLPVAFGQNQARGFAASLLGAPLGGVLFGLGRVVPFVADAITYCLELVALAMLKTPLGRPERSQDRRESSMLADVKTGLSFVWRQPFLRVSMIAAAVLNFCTLWPAYLITVEQAGVGPGLLGTMSAAAAAAGLAGSLAAPKVISRLPQGPAVIAAVWLSLLLMVVMTVSPTPVVLTVGVLGICLTLPVVNVVLFAHQAKVTPDAFIGRVSSAMMTVAMLAMPSGQALSGVLIAVGGPRLAFGVFTGAVAVGALVLTTSRAVRSVGGGVPVEPGTDPGFGRANATGQGPAAESSRDVGAEGTLRSQ